MFTKHHVEKDQHIIRGAVCHIFVAVVYIIEFALFVGMDQVLLR